MMPQLLTERDFDIAQLDIESDLDELEASFWKDYYGARPRRSTSGPQQDVQQSASQVTNGELYRPTR